MFQAPSPLQGKKLTLTYFPLPALGEPLRLLLELGGFDWTDNQVKHRPIESLQLALWSVFVVTIKHLTS